MSDELKKETNEAESESGASAVPDLSKMLDKVLANPEIIRTVASVLAQNRDDSQSDAQGDKGEDKTDADGAGEAEHSSPDIAAMAEKLPEIMKLIAPQQGNRGGDGKKGSNGFDRRTGLLSAMKPYLSRQRCEAIDYIIGFSRITDIIKNLK